MKAANLLISNNEQRASFTMPICNLSTHAIELYLKAFSVIAERADLADIAFQSCDVDVEEEPALESWPYLIYSEVKHRTKHSLVKAWCKVDAQIQEAVLLENPEFKHTLSKLEGAFIASRYPFEQNSHKPIPYGLAFETARFLSSYWNRNGEVYS
tara:strand:+ start:241 stop:705 length:465 start_codon:yes stop_codon:yes gene_type:complete